MTRFSTLALTALLLPACHPAAAKAGPTADIAVGSLVCYLPDSSGTEPDFPVPPQCPLLVVAVDRSGDKVRAIGPADRDHRLPLASLVKTGDSPLRGSLVGATDSLMERMVPGPNPGVLVPSEAYGLVFWKGKKILDTLFQEEWPTLPTQGQEIPSLEACLDSLQAAPFHGLLQGAFNPRWSCRLGQAPLWSHDSGKTVPLPAPPDSVIRISALAKPNPHLHPRAGWLFIGAGSAGGRLPRDGSPGGGSSGGDPRYWIWLAKGGVPQALRVPFMENASLQDVQALDVDGDSHPEILLDIRTDYGDGSHTDLFVLQGKAKAKSPVFGSAGISGSSGEAGGSTVQSEWWAAPPRLFVVSVQEANDTGASESHDTRVEAYRFDSRGDFKKERKDYSVVLFGLPAPRSEARSFADSLAAKRPEARKAGLRALPRLTPSGIRWQAGAVAPNARIARAWARWHKSGVVKRVKSR